MKSPCTVVGGTIVVGIHDFVEHGGKGCICSMHFGSIVCKTPVGELDAEQLKSRLFHRTTFVKELHSPVIGSISILSKTDVGLAGGGILSPGYKTGLYNIFVIIWVYGQIIFAGHLCCLERCHRLKCHCYEYGDEVANGSCGLEPKLHDLLELSAACRITG